ncbi:hypothetical protein ITJ38_17190 [Agreia pratensis]|uniref:four-carbon acid sugar kinase family protein n=1 Tax=Agreia pratensis TaxID=150121 RepID=UPI00188CA8C3|nr:four-carbon acid sugar kinase family protein [Agreia pratensis]MBF4636148.1 hypothetical protein [Agreia pratensis]
MIDEQGLLAEYPKEVAVDAGDVASEVSGSSPTLIVLDDDPTGTQSVADLPVLTTWQQSDFAWALGEGTPAIYVLTNTRSLDPHAAAARNREVVQNASSAAGPLGRRLAFVSRGDSTLRGHYPVETDAIAEAVLAGTGESVDAVIIVPAFPDAGRVTIGGVHYMRGDGGLTAIAETEFALDATFGYENSDLRAWVEEKTHGRWPADAVVTLDLATIRRGPDAITEALLGLRGATPVVVDAVTENDLRLLALGVARAENLGKNLLYRVGPPFVRARIGQAVRPPLRADEIFGNGDGSRAIGGLIVVGSHVGLTSRQLGVLRNAGRLEDTIEIDTGLVLDPETIDAHLDDVSARAVAALALGDVAMHTSRMLVKTDDPAESLAISRTVSAAVVAVVQRILASTAPRFVVAKGGITSSDVASAGLGIRHAMVRGPMLPGLVSLWEPVDGPAKGIPYVVFAGNVGDDDSLAAVVSTLTHRPL